MGFASPIRLAAAALLLIAAATDGRAAQLLSYEAEYALKPSAESRVDQFRSAAGNLGYRLGRSCRAWTISREMALALEARDGSRFEVRQSTQEREEDDGTRFRFTSQQETDGRSRPQAVGVVERRRDGAVLKLAEPQPATTALPRDTLFAVGHLASVLDAAAAGRTTHEATVFVTSLQNVREVVTRIGAPIATPPAAQLPGRNLLTDRLWPLEMTYYEAGRGREVPLETLQITVDGRGVIVAVSVVVGTLRLEGALTRLSAGRSTPC